MTADPIVVVGGGPAGAAAAWGLARGHRPVRLLERDPAPRDRICGEFVSLEAQDVLRDMGIEPAALGAPAIDRLRLVHGNHYAETALPFRAYGLSRRLMDATMLDRAAAAGVEIERGVAVRSIEGTTLHTADAAIEAGQLVLATGKHDVRGAARVSRGTVRDLVGFKSYFVLTATEGQSLCGHIEIIMFAGGYAGLQLVEGNRANLCLLVERPLIARCGRWPALLDHLVAVVPHLARRLAGAIEQLDRPLTIAGVPYGFRYRPTPRDLPGLYRVGDQCAVIPSFSGDGMSIAMRSGQSAARAILAGQNAAAYHRARRVEYRRQLAVAQGLYRVGRTRALQPLIVETMRCWPSLARQLARWTRVPTDYSSNRSAPSRSISDTSWVT